MECSNCGQANPPDARFCSTCGATLIGQEGPAGCLNCSRGDVGDGQFCRWCDQFLVGPRGVKAAGIGQRVGAYLLDFLLFFVTLIIGYLIWWLVTLRRGQTPGKQLIGIRVIRADGTPSGWGWTFIREFIIKGVVVGVLGDVLGGLPWILDLLWAFWDKDHQTLHDKIMKTIVVDDRALRRGTFAALPTTV